MFRAKPPHGIPAIAAAMVARQRDARKPVPHCARCNGPFLDGGEPMVTHGNGETYHYSCAATIIFKDE